LHGTSNDRRPLSFLCGAKINRRAMLGGMAAAAALPPVSAFGQDAATAPPQPGDYLVRATGDDQTTPLKPADIVVNAQPIQAWPADTATQTVRNGTLFNLLLVSRWDPANLSPEAQARAGEGVVAQTAICTHAACEVTDWAAEFWLMECPCHLSRFDPRNNGAVVQAPATRKLPALGLAVEGEKIVVSQPFDGRVGGDTEG
jgi:ubiquinol-cytochrome c reductase iron-sulfur subunit/rieske iron-sulfur protein